MHKNMTIERDKRMYKLLILLIKYIPPISVVMLTIHSLVCLLGVNEPVLDHIAGSSIFRAAIMLVSSYVFRFCWIHRLCVIYNLIVKIVITFHLEIGLGIFLIPCELMTFIFGVSIITLLIEHHKGFIRCNGNSAKYYKWAIEEGYK